MIRPSLAVLALVLTAGSALAQPPAGQPAPPPRARGPELGLAVEMAQQAVATCKTNGYKTTALVTDAAGGPVVLLSGDGVSLRTQDIAPTKIALVIKYKAASGVTAAKAATDTALAAEIKADPKIGTARAGALPIMVGSEMIGAIAISGAPGGDKDEACAVAGLAKVQSRLK